MLELSVVLVGGALCAIDFAVYPAKNPMAAQLVRTPQCLAARAVACSTDFSFAS